MDIASAVANVVSCFCGAPTRNYMGDHINFGDNKKELERNLGDLNRRKQDIESRIRQLRRGQKVRPEVKRWLQDVQNINADVQVLLQKAQGVSSYKRGHLGKRVRRKIDVVKAIYDQGVFSEGLVIERATRWSNWKRKIFRNLDLSFSHKVELKVSSSVEKT